MENKKKGHFFAIVGPSGVGKNTLIQKFIEDNKDLAKFPISATTRPKRINEIDGINYYFLSIKEFEEKIEKNEFIEWAEVFSNYYGTLKKTINESINNGSILIKDIDTQGALALQEKLSPEYFTTIFISPPNSEELEKRLKERGTDSKTAIEIRLSDARREMALKEKFDIIIINDNLEKAYEKFSKIILNTIKKNNAFKKIL